MHPELVRMVAEQRMDERHREAAAARRAESARLGVRQRPKPRLRAWLAKRVQRVVPPKRTQPCCDNPS